MPQQPKTPTDLKGILDPLQVSDDVKAQVWDAYQGAKTPQDFQTAFDKLQIPQDAKAALWDLKFPQLETNPTTGLVSPRGTAGETPGYFRELLEAPIRAIGGIGSFVQQTMTPHQTMGATQEEEVRMGPAGRLLYNIPMDLAQGVVNATDAAYEARRSGENWAGQTLAGLESSPAGGFVRKVEEAGPTREGEFFRFGPPTLGATAEQATNLVIPKLVGKVVGTPAEAKGRMQAGLRKLTGVEAGLREAVTKAAEDYAKKNEANEVKRTEIQEENQRRKEQSKFRAEEEERQRQERNKKTEEENAQQRKYTQILHENEEYERTEANKEIDAQNEREQQEYEQAVAQRTERAAQSEREAMTAKEQVEGVESRVYREANRKYDAINERMGTGTPEEPARDAQRLVDKINETTKDLAPDQASLFKRMIKMFDSDEELGGARTTLRNQTAENLGYGNYEQVPENLRGTIDREVNTEMSRRFGVDPEAGTAGQANWSKLQRMKTAIETALRDRNTSSVMKYHLAQVHATVLDMMGEMAADRGLTAEWREARDFYRQWREDFHEPSGPQQSGSPVAQMRDATTPMAIASIIKRNQTVSLGNLAANIMRKYGDFGGNEAAAAIDQQYRTRDSVGKTPIVPKAKPRIGGPKTAKVLPQAETEPPPKVTKILPQKKVPPPTPQPTVDARRVAQKFLEQKSRTWGTFNARDVGIISSSVILAPLIKMMREGPLAQGASNLLPEAAISYEGGKYLASRVLRSPVIIEWLERTPQAEIDALMKIPGADKVNIINGLTQEAIASAKGGRVLRLSRAAQQFLGQRNVALIYAASQANQPGMQEKAVKNRAEALQLLDKQHPMPWAFPR